MLLEEGFSIPSCPSQLESDDLTLRSEDQKPKVNKSRKLEHTNAGRKWQDSVILFHVDPKVNSRTRIRKRKQFSADQKKEVALNRAIGNCMPCRLRKGKV